MNKFWILPVLVAFIIISSMSSSFAHQDGCHRWHSCPSDSGSYTCGDKGYCSECPNNNYCHNGQPKSSSSSSSSSSYSGSYSSQSSELSVSKYTSQINLLEKENKILKDENSDLKQEIFNLKQEISDLEKRISDLNTIIKEQISIIMQWIKSE